MATLAAQDMADRVSVLMEQRLKLRGRDLEAKLRGARGRMPRSVRAEAAYLARAAALTRNPRLVPLVDPDRLNSAYGRCTRHLDRIGRWRRRRNHALDMAGSVAFRFIVTIGGAFAVLSWHGLV